MQGNEELTAPAGAGFVLSPTAHLGICHQKSLGAPCTEPSQGCSQSQAQRVRQEGSGLLGHTQGSSWSTQRDPSRAAGLGKNRSLFSILLLLLPCSSSTPRLPVLQAFLTPCFALCFVCHPHFLSLPLGQILVGGGRHRRQIHRALGR